MTDTVAPTAATDSAATHRTEHAIDVAAPPGDVFDLVADVSAWPQVFGPTVHVDVVAETAREQLLQIWALAHGQVRTWSSRRTLDRDAGRIAFRQVASASPVASMGGRWRVEPGDGATASTRVVLEHDFRVVDDDPDALRLVEQAVDRNSEAELAALKQAAELGADRDELVFTFSDTERVAGRAEDVYAFLDRAERWPERLPHVARIELTEDPPGFQHMEMDTRGPDGDVHTTTSVRVCFADAGLIVYKQLRVPPVMTGHTGRWVVRQDGDEVVATSWHTVTLNPDGVRAALGPGATMEEARRRVRQALGTNSSTTLRHAKEYAEARA